MHLLFFDKKPAKTPDLPVSNSSSTGPLSLVQSESLEPKEAAQLYGQKNGHDSATPMNADSILSANTVSVGTVDLQEQALRDAKVPESHIRIALQRQALTHEPLAEIMRSAEYGFLSPEGVARVQASISGHYYFAPAQIDSIPAEEIKQKFAGSSVKITHMETMLPIGFTPNGTLMLALSEPRAASKAHLLYPHWQHEFHVCSERSLQTIYRRAYAESGKDAMALYEQLKKIQLEEEGADQILREFVLALMRHGCYLGASDMALTPMTSESGGVVRYKIGGVGTVFTFLESHIWKRVIMHILNIAGATEKVNAGPVDTRFEFKEADLEKYQEIANRYSFRVELLQRRKTEKHSVTVVMRILDQQTESAELDALNFDEDTLRYLRDVKERATGLFLVTGPTGSGKTTTLYALLNEIDPVSRWVESIENPIEYSKGLWVQFQTDTGGNEAKGAYDLLKGLLRAAPDVILFGEIRKGDIGIELVDAGNTGHLVFTTLHTNSAALAISRLRSFGVDMSAVSNLLLGILAQRLIRTLCSCAVPDTNSNTLTILKNQKFFAQREKPFTPRCATGCIECAHTGYKGRRMIYELLKTTPTVKEMIERGDSPSQIGRAGIPPEFTLMANALRLVADGITSLDETLKLGSLEDL